MKKFAFRNFPEKGFDIVMFNKKVAAQVKTNVEANSSIFLQILGMGFPAGLPFPIKKEKEKRASVNGQCPKKSNYSLILLWHFLMLRSAWLPLSDIYVYSGFSLDAYIIFRKLVFHDLASGWPALMSILMIGFGITNISLGIIAEYLWRTLDASRKRPVFIIDEIVEL